MSFLGCLLLLKALLLQGRVIGSPPGRILQLVIGFAQQPELSRRLSGWKTGGIRMERLAAAAEGLAQCVAISSWPYPKTFVMSRWGAHTPICRGHIEAGGQASS